MTIELEYPPFGQLIQHWPTEAPEVGLQVQLRAWASSFTVWMIENGIDREDLDNPEPWSEARLQGWYRADDCNGQDTAELLAVKHFQMLKEIHRPDEPGEKEG